MKGRGSVTGLCGVFLMMSSVAARTAEGEPSRYVTQVIAPVLRGATEKLADAGCRAVFDDFRDAKGQTLSDVLQTRGRGTVEQLEALEFVDGETTAPCRRAEILAWTVPNSSRVHVCTPVFARTARREPGLAAVILIHEELHTLGLGEFPPHSNAITARVIARCGK